MSTEQKFEYRAKMVYDEEGVDPGDWLPQDEAHYNKVGPFSRKDHNGLMVECDWETWWADAEAHVENWVSYGMVLQERCPHCKTWSDAGESLWGLDFLEWQPVSAGTYTRDELVAMDSYLGEVFDDLVDDAERLREKAA